MPSKRTSTGTRVEQMTRLLKEGEERAIQYLATREELTAENNSRTLQDELVEETTFGRMMRLRHRVTMERVGSDWAVSGTQAVAPSEAVME